MKYQSGYDTNFRARQQWKAYERRIQAMATNIQKRTPGLSRADALLTARKALK